MQPCPVVNCDGSLYLREHVSTITVLPLVSQKRMPDGRDFLVLGDKTETSKLLRRQLICGGSGEQHHFDVDPDAPIGYQHDPF